MKKISIIQCSVGLASACALLLAGALSVNAQERAKGRDPFIKKRGTGTPGSGRADAGDTDQIGNILVHVEYIKVPKEKLLVYNRDSGFCTDATALRNEVQQWISNRDASILDSSLISTRSGQRAKVESSLECIYATEWTDAIPTAMETRDEGTAIEVDPIVNSDASTVALSIAPKIVTRVGETPALPTPEWFQEGDMHIPNFYSLRTSTNIDSDPESYMLLGTKSPHGQSQSTVVLAFARCGLTRLQSPKVQKPAASQLNFTFEWIEVPTATLSSWLFEQELSEVHKSAYQAALGWAASEEGTIVDLKTIQTKSGQRSTNSSASEVIYPSYYKVSDKLPTPVGYETRLEGTVVEIDAMMRPDGHHVDLAVAPEIVKQMGTFVLHRSRRKSGTPFEPDVMMPMFYTMRCNTTVSIPEDTPTLLSIMTPPAENGKPNRSRKWLLFVTARR